MINKTKKYCGFEIPEITFGNTRYSRHQGGRCCASSIEKVSFSDFNGYCTALEKYGFVFFESHLLGRTVYRTYKNGTDTVFLAFYPSYNSMRIVAEGDLTEYCDKRISRFVQPVFNQIDLSDFGISDCILLPDGRFMVIDGGWDFEPDADALMECLKKYSPDEKPIIAMWVMTHAHIDHYRAIIPFYKKYSEDVVIQNFLFNFPDSDEVYEEPVEGWIKDEIPYLKQLESIVEKSGAVFHRAHTGQVYTVSGTKLEILISPDDTFDDDNNPNILSLAMKLKICGQTIFLAGDTHFDYCDIIKMHGDYLKSDILQVPHHGFSGGIPEGYTLINPETAVYPVNEYHFGMFMHNENNRFLLSNLDLKDLYMGGSGNVSLPLPHTPRPDGKELICARVSRLSKISGARYWYFSDLTADDFEFEILSTALDADIFVDLFTEKRNEMVEHIKYTVKKDCVTKITLSEADGNAWFYNPHSLSKKGMPENTIFTARFRSALPVVITGKKTPVYKY